MDINLENEIFCIHKVVQNTFTCDTKPIKLKTYEPDKNVCSVQTVVNYIKGTEK